MSKNNIPKVMISEIKKDFKNTFKPENYYNMPINPETIDKLKNDISNYIQNIQNSRAKNIDEPLYNHDCEKCIFLGNMLDIKQDATNNSQINISFYDFYYHSSSDSVSLIARYGDNPQDYLSMRYYFDVPADENPVYKSSLFSEILDRYKNKVGVRQCRH